jgi:hypothetical protein
MNIEKIIARDHKLTEDYLKEAKLNAWQELNFNFRYWLNKRFGVWDIWDILPYKYQRLYYDKIKPIFKPQHSRLRKAIPRQWWDLSGLIVNINFEIVKSFYEDEYSEGQIDWESDDNHKKFAQWIEGAYKYITVERPELEKQMNAAYPNADFDNMFDEPETDKHGNVTYRMRSCEERCGKTYEELYGEVNRLEALIDKKDTKVITEMVKNRNYFWT